MKRFKERFIRFGNQGDPCTDSRQGICAKGIKKPVFNINA